MSKASTSTFDLDSILDQALDDFEQIESAENAKQFANRNEIKSRNNQNKVAKPRIDKDKYLKYEKVMIIIIR